jgi:hypothetical protein
MAEAQSQIYELRVSVVEYVDDHFPGWVKCEFLDASGSAQTIIEKVPVVSAVDILPTSIFPMEIWLACVVLEGWKDSQGRELVRVSTDQPWSVESIDGVTEFVVFADQIKISQS